LSGQTQRPADTKVLMGRIGAAHGIRGEVRIQSFTERPLDIATYGPLDTRNGATLTIRHARMAKHMVIATLEGVTDRTAAEKLNGTELFIDRDRLPATEDDDDFYHADLIGLEARLTDGTVLGKVLSLPNFGADDLIEIGRNAKSSTYYPFTREVVPEIDIAAGYLVVVPPDEIVVEGDE